MKRAALTLLLCALLLCACGTDAPEASPSPDTETAKVIASGECFTVEEIVGEKVTKYYYTVTAEDGTVLESAYCAERPKVSQVSEGLVGMRFTDDNHVWTRYYDTKNGVVSKSFMNAFWSDGTLVAYSSYDDDVILVVRDIFDDNGFRSETPADCLLWSVHVVAAEPSEDGKLLNVEYVEGDGENPDAEIKTAKLPLAADEEE